MTQSLGIFAITKFGRCPKHEAVADYSNFSYELHKILKWNFFNVSEQIKTQQWEASTSSQKDKKT